MAGFSNKSYSRSTCPHCGTVGLFEPVNGSWGRRVEQTTFHLDSLAQFDIDNSPVSICASRCPSCRLAVVEAMVGRSPHMVFPRVRTRAPIPDGVPEGVRADFNEAA